MKHRLSKHLSPSAKKAVLRHREGERVKAQIELARNVDLDALQNVLLHLGASEVRWHEQTHLLVVEVAAESLEEVAELEEVGYVELAERYGF